LLGLRRLNSARKAEGGHQGDGTDGQLRAVLDGVIAQDGDFEATAAEIDDATRRRFRAESGEHGFAAEARFFDGADGFKGDPASALDAAGKGGAIACFASGAGSYLAITRD